MKTRSARDNFKTGDHVELRLRTNGARCIGVIQGFDNGLGEPGDTHLYVYHGDTFSKYILRPEDATKVDAPTDGKLGPIYE